ncbi:glycosyltransferase [Iamia majanohamensis]|uniref:Glycosyltransferase n=1 Tax=Iamia majanohamensis TaxID=467976 RepID=A0AAE9Y3R1_9ACTN|nr:glycosyltransferase [Iamia majanohamensis]WCO65975.1 glycosyltransferase [Iamia majanohamensis]
MSTPPTDEGDGVLLSAVMIVRDEASRLERCLRSLQPVVDEVVVVDTGSTDETVSIAEAHGCVVGHFPWIDDFAAARNHSLDLARGEWVLMVDADEVVAPGARPVTEQLLGRPSTDLALAVLWRPAPGLEPMREVRMWRNRPDVRFRGFIHENVMDDLDALIDDGEGGIEGVDLLLEHDGYEGDQSHKLDRDLPLLEAEIASGRERPYLRQHQGAILLSLGREQEARAAWQRGADLAVEQGLCRLQDSGCHFQLVVQGAHRGWDVTSVADEAWEHFDLGVIAWALIVHGEVLGRDDVVIAAATRLISGPQAQDEQGSLDPRIFGAWPMVARGKAHLRRGDPVAAVADLRAAEEAAPWVHEYRILRQAAEAAARREEATCG